MTLSQAERAYFVRKAGGTQSPRKPLNQIKREVFAALVGTGTANSPFSELELRWVNKVLDNAGITIPFTNSIADLWKLMPIAAGVTPVQKITANQMLFYLNAA